MKRTGQKSLFFDQPITDGDVLSVWDNPQQWLTRKMIAERLDRVKSPSLIGRINNLLMLGALEVTQDAAPNGITRFWYRPRQPEQPS